MVRRGAEMPNLRLARDRRRRKILEADAVEDVLTGGKVFEQDLAGEIALRQRVDGNRMADISKAVAGRGLDQHARRPIGARPDHSGIDRHVSRLHAVCDARPVGGTAQIWLGNTAKNCDRSRRCGGRQQPAPCQSRLFARAVSNRAGHRISVRLFAPENADGF